MTRQMMNGPGHYREAERLLDEATSYGDFNPRAQWCLELRWRWGGTITASVLAAGLVRA
jgi:hypothetical protein